MTDAQANKQPGRGLLVTGIVLLVLALLGIGITVAVFGPRIDLDAFSRDVALNGDGQSVVPGQVGFRVIESLSSDQDSMTVGVAMSSSSTALECTILDVRGGPVTLRRGTNTDAFVSADVDPDWFVVVVADDLPPGEYSARCEATGEPSAVPEARFTVGRVLTDTELLDLAVPLIAIVAAVVLGGLSALVGLILVIAGTVRRRKARDAGAPPMPPGGMPGPPEQEPSPPSAWGPPPGPPTAPPPGSPGPPSSGPPPPAPPPGPPPPG